MTEEFDDGEEVARSEPLPLPSATHLSAGLMLELQRRTAPLSAELVRQVLPALLAPSWIAPPLSPALA